MERRWFQVAVGGLWLAPVVILLQHWLVWDELPRYMATHFGANGQPNGWMARETAAWFPAAILLPLLIVATVFLVRVRKPETGTWAVVALFYLIVGAMVAITQQIIAFNLQRTPIRIGVVLGTVLGGVLACIAVFLATGRGRTLPTSEVIAEERHGSPKWAVAFLVPLAAMVWLLFRIQDSGARVTVAAVSVIFVLVAAMTWSGFEYRFTRAGLEIRSLGWRLRSIPKEQIRGYQEAKWSALGGYGIRGLGSNRAYVWGNSGVRITTGNGTVFLGHSEPQRLVHDLDVLTRMA